MRRSVASTKAISERKSRSNVTDRLCYFLCFDLVFFIIKLINYSAVPLDLDVRMKAALVALGMRLEIGEERRRGDYS